MQRPCSVGKVCQESDGPGEWSGMVNRFTCALDIDDRHAVAHLNGDLDMTTVQCLVERLRPIATAGRDLVVDLAGIDFFGTAGLRALDELDRHALAAGGSIRLSQPPALVCRLLAVTGSANRFAIAEPGSNPPTVPPSAAVRPRCS
jgi:anti-sigma B factor antagonist